MLLSGSSKMENENILELSKEEPSVSRRKKCLGICRNGTICLGCVKEGDYCWRHKR